MYREEGLADRLIAAELEIKPKDVFEIRKKNDLLTDAEIEQIRRTRRTLIKGGDCFV